MNTFWGCETDDLTALSVDVGVRAARLRALIDQAAACVRATTWIGPDADDLRRRTEELVEFVIGLAETLRRLGEQLAQEAAAQDLCSAVEGPGRFDPLWAVRAAPPWWRGGGPVGNRPSLAPQGREGLWPMLGGPFLGEDPRRIAELLPDLPAPEELWPMLGGPLMAEEPPWAAPPTRPLPEGEEFALDPQTLAEAEHQRVRALGAVPYVGTVQTMMLAQEVIENGFDRAESGFEENGLGAFTPLLSLARTTHDLNGAVLGEHSVLGQVASAVDRGIANGIQTSEEVVSALGEGDPAGALRAGERGMFRHVGVVGDVLTATPVPAVADTASDLIGNGADLVAPLAPETARYLRTLERSFTDLEQDWIQGRERLTDPEVYYDLRRTYAPAPWDPQG